MAARLMKINDFIGCHQPPASNIDGSEMPKGLLVWKSLFLFGFFLLNLTSMSRFLVPPKK